MPRQEHYYKKCTKIVCDGKEIRHVLVCPEGELLEQDRKCTHNVKMKRVRATIVAEEKHAMCVRHIVICGLFGCTIFFHNL
jgi:uncharacterized protein YcbX